MFSVIFPGQGSQTVGMAKNIYERGAIELIGNDDPDHHMGK